ncbi:hypothetical protein [Parahalioglobus pacificus]|nr:hypothetical protein [Halioglobus pacificus]
MNGRHFINVASGGFGAEVTATTPQDIKRRLGGAAYTLNGLIKVWEVQPYKCTLFLPDEAPLEVSMVLIAVGNSRLAGGGFEVAPAADPRDERLDVMVLTDAVLSEPGPTLAELRDPMKPDNRRVFYRQAASFRIGSDAHLHISLDGEPVLADSLEFSVRPAALKSVY